jgi:hypothetical protein
MSDGPNTNKMSTQLPELTERGKELLRQIAEAVGFDDVDAADEHARWQVYWNAVPRGDLRVHLKEVAREGEELSRQIVVEVLRYLDESEGRTWVDLLLQGQGHDFAERRLREWALIREVVQRP